MIEEVSTHQPEVEVEDARDMRMRNVTLKALTSGFLMEYDPRRGGGGNVTPGANTAH